MLSFCFLVPPVISVLPSFSFCISSFPGGATVLFPPLFCFAPLFLLSVFLFLIVFPLFSSLSFHLLTWSLFPEMCSLLCSKLESVSLNSFCQSGPAPSRGTQQHKQSYRQMPPCSRARGVARLAWAAKQDARHASNVHGDCLFLLSVLFPLGLSSSLSFPFSTFLSSLSVFLSSCLVLFSSSLRRHDLFSQQRISC